jgi:carbonic anhydrase/acetyltransferase-like protein (isoleucine patch superfamily)
MTLARYGNEVDVARAAFIHPTAQIYGRVTVGEDSSIWPYAVIRSEVHEVVIGRCTNIQDFAILHVGYGHGVVVGDYCSITHRATLHGCRIGNNVLVGIGATVMDGCEIGDNSIIAGHALIREGTIIPPSSIVAGVPATIRRQHDASAENRRNALLYHRNALAYARGDHRAWADMENL